MKKYIAFFRGINVGGHKKVPMAELKRLFEELSFENIKTLLNSGNVLFEANETKEESLIKKIEGAFETKFGFDSRIMIRTFAEIENIISLDPFKKIKVEKHTRLYVTFLPAKSISKLKLPYASPEEDFQILSKSNREVFSVLTLKSSQSVKAMAFIEKEFGKDVTTRNWNTIIKLSEMYGL